MVSTAVEVLSHAWRLALDAAPWVLWGLVVAGLVKAYVPDRFLPRWLGGRGWGPVVRAALIGAPLPLCSCGDIPAAVGLHRQGASRGATVSFLVATPETGVDSVLVSYALLGPFMAGLRPAAAILSAIASGLACETIHVSCSDQRQEQDSESPSHREQPQTNSPVPQPEMPGARHRLLKAFRFATRELLDDLSVWLAIGLVLAGLTATLVSPGSLVTWGSGPWSRT